MSDDLSLLYQKQRDFFRSGATRSLRFRKQQLKKLYDLLRDHETLLSQALRADLNKGEMESYGTEIGPTRSEIRFLLRHLSDWMRPQRVPGMIFSFYSRGMILHEPYGTVLIISPWNYPVWLSLVPLAGAMAAGNCIILKPSEVSSHTSAALKKLFDDAFPAGYLSVVEGSAETSRQLINLPPDYIFFTGSTAVGKIVAQEAAANLIPYTLELGGKTPCIVDETANLTLSARRMMWGKSITAGQTCVSPDYLLVHENVKENLLDEIRKVLGQFYPGGALSDPDYPCIIDTRHYERLKNMMRNGTILLGGKYDDERRLIEPTLIGGLHAGDPAYNEEIFGPLLPVIPFRTHDDILQVVQRYPYPLSLYIFSNDKKFQDRLLSEIPFGGALINDTIEYLGNHHLPFGGIRSSGFGRYHGRFSFETFSHHKGVLKKSTWIDLDFKYKPTSQIKNRIMRTFLR
jgi:aldehyde dehydrogenase (NAD+)